MTISGTAGNDNLTGTSGNDTFDMTQGGIDVVNGGLGDDVINFGAVFNVNDQVTGGGGNDALQLSGDYTGANALSFNATTISGVSRILLGTGHNYNLFMDDANVAAGQTLVVNATALGASNFLSFNGGAEQDGGFFVSGGAGNDIVTGGHGNDHLVGGDGDDSMSGGGGGHDTLDGGNGNDAIDITSNATAAVTGDAGSDEIVLFGALTTADTIDGGSGFDTVELSTSTTLVFGATTMTNVENMFLTAGQHYNLTTNDATVAAGQTLFVQASNLGVGDNVVFNGSHETDGGFSITSGAGNDVLTGGATGDTLDPGAGVDTVNGGGGNDFIQMAANMTTADRIDGGAGTIDEVEIAGDYSAGLAFGANTMVNVEYLALAAGDSYKLITSNATVAIGQTLEVDASSLGAADNFSFNGNQETDGEFVILGGQGNNSILGSAGDDIVSLHNGNSQLAGGVDIVKAGAGDDTINIANFFNIKDQIDGGAGTDSLTLSAPSNATYHLGANFLTSVEKLVITTETATVFISNDANVAAGQTLTVDGSSLISGTDHFTFNGAAETDGAFVMIGGAGNDVLTGGAGADSFTGGIGADVLTGGAGADVFNIFAGDSLGGAGHYDRIVGFDPTIDKFHLDGDSITGINSTVTTGTLSAASFDTDMATALGGAHLGAEHAVRFIPNAGDLAGHTFIVISEHGSAGYAAGIDYVVEISQGSHLGNLSTGTFI